MDAPRLMVVHRLVGAIDGQDYGESLVEPTVPEVIAWLREQGAVDVVGELRFARDAMLGWAGYASDYFKDKWDLDADLARLDAALNALSPTSQEGEV